MAARIRQGWPGNRAQIAFASAAVLLLAGCVQTSRGRDEAPPAATSDPLVLSGVAYTQGNATTPANAPPAVAPNADLVSAPAANATPAAVSASPLPAPGTPPPAVVGAAPPPASTAQSVAGAAPVQPAGLSPPVASQAPTPAAPVQPADAAEYPNINIPPKQPEGKLLTPEEREKLIQELNALAGRPSSAQ